MCFGGRAADVASRIREGCQVQALRIATTATDSSVVDERLIHLELQFSRDAQAVRLERVRRNASYIHCVLCTVAAALAILDLSLLIH
jgi:hypothetical protein